MRALATIANLTTIANKEFHDGLRNRWALATTLLLGMLALGLAFLGSAPTGSVGAGRMAVTIVSLASLTVFLVPLIALLLSYDAIVGEAERGTLHLLLAYPVSRMQVILGKFLGQTATLALATFLGYGVAGIAVAAATGEGGMPDASEWLPFVVLIGTSILLGAAFVAIGLLISITPRARGTAAGIAVGVWLVAVVLFDLVLLGALSASEGRGMAPALFNAILLANPTDAFRLVNLTGDRAVAEMAGMVAATEGEGSGFGTPILALMAWIVVPLGLAGLMFSRKEL